MIPTARTHSRINPRALCCLLALVPGLPLASQPGQRFGVQCSRARAGAGIVRVLHFGDSHLAGTEAGLEFTRYFHAHCGDGGPGFGLPWVARRPGVTTQASRGWLKTRKAHKDGRTGLAGLSLETTTAGEWASLEARFAHLRVDLARDPAGGRAMLLVDGAPQGEVDLAGAPGAVFLDRTVPEGRHKVEVRVTRGGLVRLLGVALETRAGAAYSPLPCIGARSSWLNDVPEALFRAQVAAATPDLVILAFGTNEANARDLNPEAYRMELDALLARFRTAAPQAALLLVGPPDGILKAGSPANLDHVIAVQRAAAAASGALFLDQRQAMGGPGSVVAWQRSGWANQDLVHMSPAGYERLARFSIQGLFEGTGQAYAVAALKRPAAREPEPRAPAAPPLFTFRNREGRLFITDNPAKVKDLPGEWNQEPTP